MGLAKAIQKTSRRATRTQDSWSMPWCCLAVHLPSGARRVKDFVVIKSPEQPPKRSMQHEQMPLEAKVLGFASKNSGFYDAKAKVLRNRRFWVLRIHGPPERHPTPTQGQTKGITNLCQHTVTLRWGQWFKLVFRAHTMHLYLPKHTPHSHTLRRAASRATQQHRSPSWSKTMKCRMTMCQHHQRRRQHHQRFLTAMTHNNKQ